MDSYQNNKQNDMNVLKILLECYLKLNIDNISQPFLFWKLQKLFLILSMYYPTKLLFNPENIMTFVLTILICTGIVITVFR